MNFKDKTIKDFIEIIIQCNNVEEILSMCNLQNEKGLIFERLWDILIKFGYCDKFPKSQYIHKINNANNALLKDLTNLDKYLNSNVFSGNSSGYSDITLFDKTTNKYIFITSKYPKTSNDITKQKSVDYYDIHKIVSMINDNKNIYKNFDIYVLVPDKHMLLEKVTKANKSSNNITKYITKDKIMDQNDLNKLFLLFKNDMIKYNSVYNNNVNFDQLYMLPKDMLKLRFHQELITQKTSLLIDDGNKSFLWGCKCRSGKTYMAGGIIIKQFNKKNKLNVLIITPVPTETIPQFTEDLFDKFKDFDNFKIHHINGIKSITSINNGNIGNNNIFIASKQLMQKYIDKKTIMNIKNLNLDMIIFDENHFSGTTELAKNILTSYASQNTVKIYLTATFNKPLCEWQINNNCCMYWDIEDEQICKSINVNKNNINKLIDKHGEYVNNTITYFNNLGYDIDDIFEPYLNMPDLHLMTNLFEKEKYVIIKQKIMGTKYGFSFDVLFSLKDGNKQFNYENEVLHVLRYISGSQKEIDFKNGDKSIFGKINTVCTRDPYTQIWFLPSDNINDISSCLMNLMKIDGILKQYDVLCINRGNNNLAKDVKDEIIKCELNARETGKRGLILLAGNMLSLGITISSCDVVMLLNNSLSVDKVMQQMYRCMTEGKDKKMGFVVDLNISRVLRTIVNYSVYKHDENVENKIKYLIENNLINIDADMLINKKINSDIIVSKLMDIWKDDPLNSFQTLLKNLDNEYIVFDNVTQKLINNYFMDSHKGKIVKGSIVIKDGEDEIQTLPTGKNIIVDEDNNNDDNDDKIIKEKEIEEIQISFPKDVLQHVIPLICMLTIKNKNTDFTKMICDIEKNKELLEIFDDQCYVWWNRKDLLGFIKNIVGLYYKKNSVTYNVAIQIKLTLQNLLDKPKELLEIINNSLKPKKADQKQYGEVFTPMNFINDSMLKDLEKYYMDKYGKLIWNDKNITFYDPAAGMGNFPIAIYYKLLDGLSKVIPNVNERKKHILENQLYMGELNKKNCFIIKQIFDINNLYKLNLYNGDTLVIDINKIFNKNKFDVIIGNPPYNEELTKTGARPLYNKFIEYYVDKCNIITFVVPSRWFSGGKGLDNFRNMMLNRKDIVYINNFNDATKVFGNHVDIKGGVNYFLIDKNYNGLCKYDGSLIKLNNFDIIIDSKYYNIINKVSIYDKLTNIYLGRYFGIETNDKNLMNSNKDNNLIKCYVSQQKGFIKYIDKKFIKNSYDFYKVITAEANGVSGLNSGFGNIFIGKPNEVHSGSYLSFKVTNEIQANSLLSYLKCKLPNFMLSLRKITQHISESTCKWIPLPPLNKIWNDDDVYKYFKLTNDEIILIKDTKISGYKDLIKYDYKIIKHRDRDYYLIDNKLCHINNDKSIGKQYANYDNGKISIIQKEENW